MNTKTKVAGIELDSCILNASGPKDATMEELEAIANSASAAIMMKSCTIEPREGNEEPRWYDFADGYIQSMGLPNLGYKKYVKFAAELKKNYKKPVVASVSGFSQDDYVTMVKAFQKSEADLIEVNLSCPNIKGKPQVGYDFEQSENVLAAIDNLGKKPIGLKLPPYFDMSHYAQMAEIVLRHKISFVTCINSIGNTLIIDPEKESTVIKPNDGLGGLSGARIKPIGLANVRTFYNLLGGKVSIMGVGGISTGTDAFEYLLAGADAVQIATTFEKEGPGCFERISNELKKILKRKGYNSIESAKGKLKYL